MTTTQYDPFTAGYIKGFQDRQAHRPRKDTVQDGSLQVSIFKMGYELGYDHGVAFAISQNNALNIMIDQIFF